MATVALVAVDVVAVAAVAVAVAAADDVGVVVCVVSGTHDACGACDVLL